MPKDKQDLYSTFSKFKSDKYFTVKIHEYVIWITSVKRITSCKNGSYEYLAMYDRERLEI